MVEEKSQGFFSRAVFNLKKSIDLFEEDEFFSIVEANRLATAYLSKIIKSLISKWLTDKVEFVPLIFFWLTFQTVLLDVL